MGPQRTICEDCGRTVNVQADGTIFGHEGKGKLWCFGRPRVEQFGTQLSAESIIEARKRSRDSGIIEP